jgi:tellurite resistance protein TerC
VEFLYTEWLTKPVWMWLAFIGIVVTLLVLDLGVLHREQREIGVKESLMLSAGYLALGITFAILAAGIVWSLWKTRARPQPA